MTPEIKDTVQKHLDHSEIYFANGQEALNKGEVSKAGEMFWGSVTQAFHALAAVRGADVATHRKLKNFAIQIADEISDQNLLAHFLAVEILHKGFYDIDVELPELERGVHFSRNAIDLVSGLIPAKLNGQPNNES